MKKLRFSLILALALCLGLSFAGLASAKEGADAYRLCLEGGAGMPGAPVVRLDLLVAHPTPGAVANATGKMVLSNASINPPLVITFDVKGTYDTKPGAMELTGMGGGTDNAKYEAKVMVELPAGKKKGPYEIQYKRVGEENWQTTKGEATTVPCVKTGANK